MKTDDQLLAAETRASGHVASMLKTNNAPRPHIHHTRHQKPAWAALMFLWAFLFSTQAQTTLDYVVEEIPIPGTIVGFNNNGVVVGQQDNGFYVYSNGFKIFPDFRDTLGLAIPRAKYLNNNNEVLFQVEVNTIYDSLTYLYLYQITSHQLTSLGRTSSGESKTLIGFSDKGALFGIGYPGYTNLFLWSSVGKTPISVPPELDRIEGALMNDQGTIVIYGTGGTNQMTQIFLNRNSINTYIDQYSRGELIAFNVQETILGSKNLTPTNQFASRGLWRNKVFKELLGPYMLPAAVNNNDTLAGIAATNVGTLTQPQYKPSLLVFKNDIPVYDHIIDVSINRFAASRAPLFINDRDEIAIDNKIFRPVMRTAFAPMPTSRQPMQFQVQGQPGRSVEIESSTNLNQWTPLQKVVLGEQPTIISDADSAKTSKKYFRAKEDPQ